MDDDMVLRMTALDKACSKHGMVDNLQSDVDDTNGRRERLLATAEAFYSFLSASTGRKDDEDGKR